MPILTLEQLNDDSLWDFTEKDYPIFCEHSLYEDKNGRRYAVQRGDTNPDKKAKLLYTIDESDLEQISDEINKSLKENLTPVKIVIGHRTTGNEKEQPELSAYGVGAHIKKLGSKNKKFLCLKKIQYLKGKYEEARGYPERSPEFKPSNGKITALALLRHDPKLEMGVTSYGNSNDEIFYGEIMSDMINTNMNYEEKEMETKEPDPTSIPSPEMEEPDPALHQEFMSHLNHAKTHDPVLKYCTAKYAEEMQAKDNPMEAEDKAKNEDEDKDNTNEKPKEERPINEDEEKVHMSENYAELANQIKQLTSKLNEVTKVNSVLSQKYGESEAKRTFQGLRSEGYVIKNPQKLMDKLTKTDDAGRKAIVEDVRENYAQEKVQYDPTMIEQIGVIETNIEKEEAPSEIYDEFTTTEAWSKMIKYAEENKLDFKKDKKKIYAALKEKK